MGLFGVLTLLAYLLRWVAEQGFWSAEAPPRHAWHVLEGALWAAVVLALLLAPLRTKWLFSNRILGAVGVLSYSLFLIHFPVLALGIRFLRNHFPEHEHFARWDAETVAIVVMLFAGCLGASLLTYALVEKPFFARKAQLAG